MLFGSNRDKQPAWQQIEVQHSTLKRIGHTSEICAVGVEVALLAL
jgi:hypothetical protein